MTTAYIFERDLCIKCNTKRLKRVVTAIDHGQVEVPGFGPVYNMVYFIIFEKADGDIRDLHYQKIQKSFDLAWCMRTLHNASVGLMELHLQGVAHQDLKPSNLLFFSNKGSKLTDLGRSHDENISSPVDSLPIPGAKIYAPPEQKYGYKLKNEFESRIAGDLYMLGSLIYFYFLNLSATTAMWTKLIEYDPLFSISPSYEADLPFWQKAFSDTISILELKVKAYTPRLYSDIVILAKNLCEPDIRNRGFLKKNTVYGGQQGLEKIITRFNIIADSAEHGFI
jgi:serine/threonine protein kinase